jgi:hypothetical protein
VSLLRPAHSLVKLQVESPERSKLLSTTPSGSLQTSRESSPGSSSNRLATTLPTTIGHRDLRSCIATTATMEIDPKESETPPDNAKLSVLCPVILAEHAEKVASFVCAADDCQWGSEQVASISTADSHFVSCKILLSENVQPTTHDPKNPQPIPNLTPSTPVGIAARWSSPSPPGRNSGSSTHLTMPPSSPLTESSIMSVARDDDSHASFTGNSTEIHDYLAKAMSSPTLYGDESTFSPSSPYQMAMSTKRTFDDSYEVGR